MEKYPGRICETLENAHKELEQIVIQISSPNLPYLPYIKKKIESQN